MGDERRKFKRYPIDGIKSNISDGSSVSLVVVEDLSKNGVSLSQVPTNFDETVKKEITRKLVLRSKTLPPSGLYL